MALEELQNGRYRRIRLLGSGGMGEVHLMEDTRVGRRVAIKVIRSETGYYPESKAAKDATRLFIREARAIAALEHPNILPLYDFGEEIIDNMTVYYMVMPYCAEGTLIDWQRQRRDATVSMQDIAYIVDQAAAALQYAHDHQVIHLDVKPSNFLIRGNAGNPDRPTVMLADFGLARNTATVINSSRAIRGTPTFMAPEQWNSSPVLASDQYALATMIYEMLMGNPPFTGTMDKLLFHHLSTQPMPPSTLRTDLTADIDSVILRALAKRPEERFPSIMAFSRAFMQAVRALPTPTPSPVEPIVEPQQSDEGDIRAAVHLTQAEADAGASRMITMPNGQMFTVPVPGGVHDGEVIRVQGSDESSNSGKVVFLTIGIKQAEETSPTIDVLSEAPTLYSLNSNENASPSPDVLSAEPTLYTPTSTEETSSSSDVLSAAPMPIMHEPTVTPQPSFDPVPDHEPEMKDASDSKAAPEEEQPAPSFFKRVLTRGKRLISGSE